VLAGLRRLILWEYPRAGWQYDIIAGIITAFVFLTPRAWFHDQPRIPQLSRIMLMHDRGGAAYLVEPELILPIPESTRATELSKMISARTGRKQTVSRIDPIFNSEQDVRLYVVYTRP
jgi:hypothetical protein